MVYVWIIDPKLNETINTSYEVRRCWSEFLEVFWIHDRKCSGMVPCNMGSPVRAQLKGPSNHGLELSGSMSPLGYEMKKVDRTARQCFNIKKDDFII